MRVIQLSQSFTPCHKFVWQADEKTEDLTTLLQKAIKILETFLSVFSCDSHNLVVLVSLYV